MTAAPYTTAWDTIPGWTPLTANMHYGFGWTNTVTAFVIQDGQITNVDEKQGNWWEYQDNEPFSFDRSSGVTQVSLVSNTRGLKRLI